MHGEESRPLSRGTSTASPLDLADFLEDGRRNRDFYDVLGGLSDNLMTIGTFAGTFLTCESCGDTFTLKDMRHRCGKCGAEYGIHISTRASKKEPRYLARLSGLKKPGVGSRHGDPVHWYYNNENWCVARWISLLLRLPARETWQQLANRLGVPVRSEESLESILCWGRLKLESMKNTIQPDVAVSFAGTLLFFEFKRPQGGRIPPEEILGQLYFSDELGRRLGSTPYLVLIPGNAMITKKHTSNNLVAKARAHRATTLKKWSFDEDVVERLDALSDEALAGRVRVMSWEDLLHASLYVTASCQASPAGESWDWNARSVQSGLTHFWRERADLDLLAEPSRFDAAVGTTG